MNGLAKQLLDLGCLIEVLLGHEEVHRRKVAANALLGSMVLAV